MKNNILTVIKYAFFLALGGGLLYFAFRNTDPTQMIGEIRQADYFWVGASVAVGIFSYYSRAARWLVLLEPLGYKPKLSNSLYSVFFGYFANIAAPRIGELARCTALNQTEKIPLNALIGTVILERVLDVVILFSLILISFLLNADLFGQFFLNLFSEKLQTSGTGGLIWGGIAVLLLSCLLLFLLRKKLMQLSFAEKLKAFLQGIYTGFSTIGKMQKKGQFIFHTLVIWSGYILMTYTGFFALSETAHLSFADSIFITVAGGLGMAVPANGGIGTFHTAVMFGMAALGIEKHTGLVFATIMHASQVLFVLLTGSFSFVMLYIEKNKRSTP